MPGCDLGKQFVGGVKQEGTVLMLPRLKCDNWNCWRASVCVQLSHMAPAGLETDQPELTAAALLQQPQQASGPFSALPPQPPSQQPVVQESSQPHEEGAQPH